MLAFRTALFSLAAVQLLCDNYLTDITSHLMDISFCIVSILTFLMYFPSLAGPHRLPCLFFLQLFFYSFRKSLWSTYSRAGCSRHWRNYRDETDKNFCLQGTDILVRKKVIKMCNVLHSEKPKFNSKQKEAELSKHFFQYL